MTDLYIIGGLDDQTKLLVWSKLSNTFFSIDSPIIGSFPLYRDLFSDLLHPLFDNQPLAALFISTALSLLGKNGINILILFTLILNYICSTLLFSRFRYGFLYALIFTFSSFAWSHLGIHLVISQIWVYPLGIYLLLRLMNSFSTRGSIILGVFIAIVVLISNYHGFFLILYCVLFMLLKLVIDSVRKRKIQLPILRSFFIFFFSTILISGIFLFPYIRTTYLGSDRTADFKWRTARSYEDFFTFSSRPWYFLLPPVKNPWFGSISKEVLSRLEITNYFLADDYFATEHSGNYFGLLFLITVFISVSYVLLRGELKTRISVFSFLVLSFVLFLFMFPPFFTVSGIKMWTLGFFIYKFFPIFRVTSRLCVLILLNLLLALGYSINFIVQSISKRERIFLHVLMSCVFLITLIETYVPPKLQKVTNPPEVYTYLSSVTKPNTRFAVYPYSETQQALFWLSEYERYLLNPREYRSSFFDTEVFTENLSTEEGLLLFKDLGGRYLIVFDCDEVDFFLASDHLSLEKKFKDSYLFKVL